MAEVLPFYGLRYDESRSGPLSDLVCPPYDVIGDDDRARLYERSPHNAVRIEAGRDEAGDDPTENRYTRAKATLDQWLEKGVVRVDPTPAFYLYDHYFELGGARLRRRGFLGALRVYQEGRGIMTSTNHIILPADLDALEELFDAIRYVLAGELGKRAIKAAYPAPDDSE